MASLWDGLPSELQELIQDRADFLVLRKLVAEQAAAACRGHYMALQAKQRVLFQNIQDAKMEGFISTIIAEREWDVDGASRIRHCYNDANIIGSQAIVSMAALRDVNETVNAFDLDPTWRLACEYDEFDWPQRLRPQYTHLRDLMASTPTEFMEMNQRNRQFARGLARI